MVGGGSVVAGRRWRRVRTDRNILATELAECSRHRGEITVIASV